MVSTPTKHWPELESFPRSRERYQLLCKLAPIAERMRSFGVRVDITRAMEHVRAAKKRKAFFASMFCRLTGLAESALGASGAGQTKEVKEWFKRVGAPDVVFEKRTKKPQFNSTALTVWAMDFKGQRFSEPAAALLGLRKAATARQFAWAYVEVATRSSGRIHFGFNVMGTKGERWSASSKFSWMEEGVRKRYSLNAQNVPAKDVQFTFADDGPLDIMVSLRNIFIPDTGCVWVKHDYEALEARLIAYVTCSKKLIEWIEQELDIHIQNACALFPEVRIPPGLAAVDKGALLGTPEALWARAREAAKPCIYALTYTAPLARQKGPQRNPELFKQLKQIFPKTTEAHMSLIIDRFFKTHTEIRAWQHEVAAQLTQKGHVELPQTGRRLYLPDSPTGRNQAQNFFFQSGGGAMLNRAIPLVADLCDWRKNGSAILLMVHDELSMQYPEKEAAALEKEVSSLMAAPTDFGGIMASIPAGGEFLTTWGGPKCVKPELKNLNS